MKDFDTSDKLLKTDAQAFGTLRQLRELRVVVETDIEDQLELLVRELKKMGAEPRLMPRQAGTIPAEADVVFCDYSPDLERRLPWSVGEATAALIVMLPHQEPFSSTMLEALTPDAVLARPFTANAIKASTILGVSQFRYERRLRSKAARLEENLRAMRAIERAKTIVMTMRSISSEEAYRFLRSQAMARRQPVSSIAEAIVASYAVLGGLPPVA